MLTHTKLATVFDDSSLARLAELGETIQVEPETVLFRRQDAANYLYIILDGFAFLDAESPAALETWVGPGDLTGAIDFLLGRQHRRTARSGPGGCLLWRMHRSRLFQHETRQETILLTRLLTALTPHVQTRLPKSQEKPAPASDLAETHCDYWHPEIQRAALLLKGRDDWETAIAIWHFVQRMPYRFGLWNMKASETFRLGYGMCTTKANLQVALLRANGIPGGFAKMAMPSDFVRSLLPPGYRGKVNKTIKHYFAAVKLEGRWFPCDASFTPEAVAMMGAEDPKAAVCAGQTFKRGQPLNLVSLSLGGDPGDYELLLDLAGVMDKRPFYDHHHLDAMNVLLDKAQGPVFRQPPWVGQVERLLDAAPLAGFQRAYASLTGEIYERERAQPVSLQRQRHFQTVRHNYSAASSFKQ